MSQHHEVPLPSPGIVHATGIFCSALKISTLLGPLPLTSLLPILKGQISVHPLPGYAFGIPSLHYAFNVLCLTVA